MVDLTFDEARMIARFELGAGPMADQVAEALFSQYNSEQWS